ncbi:M23 family metallopeptidase [Leifsonia poae]|uniref:M23ase beta-sheet core domain-containing protein n=1 Tax=Leifsonia poae TaxID=110933 RepID=A0A9W6H9T6_9MICO|nr:M23 family metallopeptidase [Leifsonia poae]GLJ76372.1 hypothetical protein GCM10017584_19460 [Leifsonia poae]
MTPDRQDEGAAVRPLGGPATPRPVAVDAASVVAAADAAAAWDVAAQPLTRRELRERERAEEAAKARMGAKLERAEESALAAKVERAEEAAQVAKGAKAERAEEAAQPELAQADHSPRPADRARAMTAAPSVPRAARRKPVVRRKSAVAKGFSLLAMTFAVAMAVATSVPAMALLSEGDVRAQVLQQQLAPAAAVEPQAMADAVGGEVASIIRDGADVTSAEQVSATSHMRIADTFTNNPRGAVQWPFAIGVPISDWYGPRVAPTEGASTNHPGIDFAPGVGVPIQIIADGVVREVVPSDNGGCGVNVTIDHMIGGALVASKYCHMMSGSVRVAVGQAVKVGDIVGLVGNTGISTGAHLHFEILLNGTEHTDPYVWLKANAS